MSDEQHAKEETTTAAAATHDVQYEDEESKTAVSDHTILLLSTRAN